MTTVMEFNIDMPHDDLSKNPMIRKNGKSETEEKCRQCKFLLRVNHNGKLYSKCEYRGISRGAGTDHSIYWDACSLLEIKK